MKIFCWLMFFVVSQLSVIAQTSNLFHIKKIAITDTSKRKKPADFSPANLNFFEDDNYVVRKTCSGEWGGTIWFKNKKTGTEHSCTATCPIVVNKLHGKYIVTCTLAHMYGFSQVIEIGNPESMSVFKFPLRKDKSGKMVIGSLSDNESKSTQGSRVLIDTMRVMMLVSFPYKNQLFHVITDNKNTYIAKIEHRRFVVIDALFEKDISSYDPEVIKTKDKHFIVFFKNEQADGYLDIFENNITLTTYR